MPVTGTTSGMLSFVRYAFMPNHLGYCGGTESETLFEHATDGNPDDRLIPLLAKFGGALPYLQTIAGANGIRDPFDEWVVEAYWIGNGLLERVDSGRLQNSLEERFGKHLSPKMRPHVLHKPREGARPHHFFHVADVYRHLEPEEVGMAAIEGCRISWGRVTAIDGSELVVDRRPVVLRGSQLVLDDPRSERIRRSLDGRGFADAAQVGDWVSIHWGWTCEILDERKRRNLEHYTGLHLALANRTI
jgi:hypothetical protein